MIIDPGIALVAAALIAAIPVVFGIFTNRKLNAIHTLANSNLAEANKRLDGMNEQVKLANKEISGLREMMASMRTVPAADVPAASPKLEVPEGVKVLEVKTEAPDSTSQ